MQSTGIVLLGLGPGNPDLLTRQAWQILEKSREIYLRTKHHPIVDVLPHRIELFSFDSKFENGEPFNAVTSHIVERILDLGRRPQGVIYAVPGHPMIAEATSPEIYRRAKQSGIPVKVVDGISVIESAFSALGMDPFPQIALIDALELAAAHTPSFPTNIPALIAHIYPRAVASDVKLTLMSLYPDVHPVRMVHAAGTSAELVEDLPLYQIDRSDHLTDLTALYLLPLGAATSFEEFLEIVAHLRSPDGCPWDREQTHKSLRDDLLEETYEALAALDLGDADKLCEELGDLILLILLHTQIASDEGEFTIADVLRGIHTKIVRRHPHVFGDLELADEQAILKNWERLKEAERQQNGTPDRSLLDGVALALPALVQAEIYQKRAARVGFDWPDIKGVLDKMNEELAEVHSAPDEEQRAMEIGDLIFAVVNLARWYKVDAESALRETNARFRKRFSYIESSARKSGNSVADLTLDQMEKFWQEAKRQ